MCHEGAELDAYFEVLNSIAIENEDCDECDCPDCYESYYTEDEFFCDCLWWDCNKLCESCDIYFLISCRGLKGQHCSASSFQSGDFVSVNEAEFYEDNIYLCKECYKKMNLLDELNMKIEY